MNNDIDNINKFPKWVYEANNGKKLKIRKYKDVIPIDRPIKINRGNIRVYRPPQREVDKYKRIYKYNTL
jgi:hypothetical protein